MKTLYQYSKLSIITVVLSLVLPILFSCQQEQESKTQKNIDEMFPESGEDALKLLLEGNKRFVSGKSQHRREGIEWRKKLTQEQHPFATILGCSDARVPIELLFDQGFGVLFIIRVAGNVLGSDERGSIAYAVDHLHTPLVLVLGHEGCGAVTAAMLPEEEKQKEAPFLQLLLKSIEPALQGIDPKIPQEERIHQGVQANIKYTVQKLVSVLKQYEKNNNILVVGAVYQLSTGLVKIIEKN
jgi:carbonic anhydrase